MSEQTAVDVDELRRRIQRLAPEALAGDADALAELDAIEDQVAQELRRQELAELASAEELNRARVAAEEAAVAERAERTAIRDDALRKRQTALIAFERHLDRLVAAAREALEQGWDADALSAALGDLHTSRHLAGQISDRITRRLREIVTTTGSPPRPVLDLGGPLMGTSGMAPLAVAPARAKSKTPKD